MLASFEYHIVRIVKTDQDSPDVFEGMVEKAGKKGWKTFRSFDELRDILDSKRQKKSIDVRHKRPGNIC